MSPCTWAIRSPFQRPRRFFFERQVAWYQRPCRRASGAPLHYRISWTLEEWMQSLKTGKGPRSFTKEMNQTWGKKKHHFQVNKMLNFAEEMSAADWVCLDGFGDLISLLGKQFHPYCWWQPEIRRSVTTWGKGSFHHYVQGFIHLRWLAGFLPSTVSPKVVWTLALQFGVSKESPGHQLKCS